MDTAERFAILIIAIIICIYAIQCVFLLQEHTSRIFHVIYKFYAILI